MSNRRQIIQIVSEAAPIGAALGDEWVQPSTNRLYKRIISNSTPDWVEIIKPDSAGNIAIAGTIHSTTGGFKFPDGTTQVTSAAGQGGTNITLQSYRETVTTVTPVTGTATLDLSTANIFTVTLTAASTALAFSNAPAVGVAFSITLIVKQDATGNRALTYPASCRFTDGVTPILTTVANRTDVITFFTVDGGATFLGGHALANLS